MERGTKITNTEGQTFFVIENHMGRDVFIPQIPIFDHRMRSERDLEVDSENPQGEWRNHLTPEELLARDE